ncbi:hypothetical protein COV19_00800 [Candidatus Woesearchaeota archaeon CG10_big_fil_rev_8_21_14_0_10_44_13]|nr:MAG: hypothetical protein COV19_00800 [Candidatus Woesearchaeota archaeon CG10_big_fil_rev_8_21_14_0_10_44_13]
MFLIGIGLMFGQFWNKLVYLVIILLVVYLIVYCLILEFVSKRKWYEHLNELILRKGVFSGILLWIVVITFVYIMVMSVIFSDVKVVLDKEFYTTQDFAQVSIKSEGYILNPAINSISYEGRMIQNKSDNNINLKINLSYYFRDDLDSMNYLSIKFEPQIFPLIKEKIIYLKIVE